MSSEIALARRLSPHRGGRVLAVARRMVSAMPQTLAAMREGTLSERRAGLVAGEAVGLAAAEQSQLDEAMCADADRIAGRGGSAGQGSGDG